MNAAIVAQVGLPNPVDVVTRTVTSPTGWAWERVSDGITSWVLGAVAYFVEGVVNFLLTSARPDVEAAWFTGSGSPYATVRGIAVALLLAFLFLGLIQALLAGDSSAMLRRVVVDLPAAVFGMVATTVVVGKLLELTDALSAAVLSNSDQQAVDFLSGFGASVNDATNGFAAVVLGLVAVIAGMVVWIELMVRSVLVYILVALSPLSFAAMVWPSARGVLRRTIELLLAVIVSKLVICIAISVGVAALAGASTAAPPGSPATDQAAAGMGTLLVGTAVLAMGAFAPFLVLKLIPWAESAAVAQGVSRGPVRSAQATMSNVYYAQSLNRLAGGGHSKAAIGSSSAGAGWSVGPQALGGGAAAGTTTTAIGSAAGPAGVAAAGTIAVGSKAASTGAKTAETASDTGGSTKQRAANGDTPPTRERRSSSADAKQEDGE